MQHNFITLALMNIVDLIILFIACFWFLKGYFKGIIIEIFTLAALFLGITASLNLTTEVLGLTESFFIEKKHLVYILYMLVFLSVFLAIFFLGKLIEKIMKITNLNIFNRISGGIAGVLKVIFTVSLLFWLSEQAKILPESIMESSFTYLHLRNFAPLSINFISETIPFLSDIIQKTEALFIRISESI